jgi:hypothetical protein
VQFVCIGIEHPASDVRGARGIEHNDDEHGAWWIATLMHDEHGQEIGVEHGWWIMARGPLYFTERTPITYNIRYTRTKIQTPDSDSRLQTPE